MVNLTEKEKEVLPLGAYTMTLECGTRFLTDYIDGDNYFGTYPLEFVRYDAVHSAWCCNIDLFAILPIQSYQSDDITSGGDSRL